MKNNIFLHHYKNRLHFPTLFLFICHYPNLYLTIHPVGHYCKNWREYQNLKDRS